jgi:glycosyltransferase involved in cell wall biosynthesis
MDDKAKILAFVDYYLPGYKAGGPIRALEHLTNYLSEKFDFYIVTRSNDQDGEEYRDVERNKWSPVGAAKVKYLDQGARTLLQIAGELLRGRYDTVYLNSFFSSVFSIFPIFFIRLLRLNRRIVIAPRGEFCAGAVSINATKKIFYIKLIRFLGIYKNVTWQASTQTEVREIQIFFPEANCHVAKELSPRIIEGSIANIEKRENELKIIFVSRISRKKNLHFAIKILAAVMEGQISFDIYGPIEDDDYWGECLEEIGRLPGNVTAAYKGELIHTQVVERLSSYHLFFLPTFAENFGYVILESFLAGRPVLISDQTPWQNLADAGVGFDVSLEHAQLFRVAIENYLSMNQMQFDAVIDRVSAYVKAYASEIDAEVRRNVKLFENCGCI